MKAAVCREFGQALVIEDVQLREPAAGEVRVAIKACAICHSDLICLDGGWAGPLPIVCGHEAAGLVAAVGEGVTAVAAGEHVVVTLIRSCGQCHYCERGDAVMCEAEFRLAAHSPLSSASGDVVHQGLYTGAFAEEVVVDASQVCAIPTDLSFDSASLLACGVLAGFGAVMNTARPAVGATVVVVGIGGVGINCVQGAVAARADVIIAVDANDSKLETACHFGATHAINGSEAGVVDKIRHMTGGRGADFVFVAVGIKAVIDKSLDLLAFGGTAVIVSMPESGVVAEYDPGSLASRSQRIIGSRMGSARVANDIPKLVSLYQQGSLKLDELISERYPFEEINAAIASSKSGGALRNVILFE